MGRKKKNAAKKVTNRDKEPEKNQTPNNQQEDRSTSTTVPISQLTTTLEEGQKPHGVKNSGSDRHDGNNSQEMSFDDCCMSCRLLRSMAFRILGAPDSLALNAAMVGEFRKLCFDTAECCGSRADFDTASTSEETGVFWKNLDIPSMIRVDEAVPADALGNEQVK